MLLVLSEENTRRVELLEKKMEFSVKSGTSRGVCIPRSSKVHRLAKHRFFATAKVSQEVSQVL